MKKGGRLKRERQKVNKIFYHVDPLSGRIQEVTDNELVQYLRQRGYFVQHEKTMEWNHQEGGMSFNPYDSSPYPGPEKRY